jgi:NADH-quinone oxidoreductase subunit H
MAEYSNIIWISIFLSFLFFSPLFLIMSFLFILLFLLLRAAYPRLRYDYLMKIMWKIFLSIILFSYLWVLCAIF